MTFSSTALCSVRCSSRCPRWCSERSEFDGTRRVNAVPARKDGECVRSAPVREGTGSCRWSLDHRVAEHSSQPNALDLVERQAFLAAVVKLGSARAFMCGHSLRMLVPHSPNTP